MTDALVDIVEQAKELRRQASEWRVRDPEMATLIEDAAREAERYVLRRMKAVREAPHARS